MDNLNKLNSFNNLKTLNDSNGNSVLISNGISSLNFDGNIPKRSTIKNVSELIKGDIVTDSDIVKANKSFLITTIEKQTYNINNADTDVYFLYYLSDTDGEKPLTYLSPYTSIGTAYYGGYNTDQLFYVFSDDIDNINLGNNGWMISNSGNAVFANGFFRGRIEATEGIFSGTVTAGTADASIKIGRDLFNLEQFPDTGTAIVSAGNEAHGLIIDDTNYFFTSIYNNIQNITSLTIADETSYQDSDKTYEYYATISYTSPFSFDQNINPNTLINQSSNIYISQLLDTGTNTDFGILNTEWFPAENNSILINGNVSRTGTTATINCTKHGLVAGNTVVISDLTGINAPLNGQWTVLSSGLTSDVFKFTTVDSGTIIANTPSNAFASKIGSFKIKLPYKLTQYPLNTDINITGAYANNNLFPEPISLVKINLTEVEVPKTTSTCQLTVGFNPTSKYSLGENIYLTGFTVSSDFKDLTPLNGSFKIIALTSSTITVRSFRMTAGTAITTGLGSIQDTLQKSNFKVGSANKYMSYDSDTDILKVTGEINATSGTFTGKLSIGPILKIGVNASPSNRDGIYFDANNYWTVEGEVGRLSAEGAAIIKPIIRIEDTGAIQTSLTVGDGTANSKGIVIDKNSARFYPANSSTPKTIISNSTGIITATEVDLTGKITASSGIIGGFTIGGSSLYAGSGSNFVGIIPASLPLFAGATDNLGTNAKFSVSNTGAITSTSGSIGGWSLASGEIYSGTGLSKISLNSNSGKITIGTGNHGSVDTGFYTDSVGKFSLSNQLIFNPGTGNNSSFNTTGTFTTSVATITVPSGLTIVRGMTVTGTGIDTNTYVTNVSGTTITISKTPLSNQTGIALTFVLDDFAELQVVGRIKGVIDSTQIIGSPRLSTTISQVVVSGTSPNQTATITTGGHAFLANEKIVIESLPVTNGLNKLNREFVIQTITDSITLSVDLSGVTGVTSGTNSGLSGVASLRELTMGLHPQESVGTTYEHSQGTGIRLDKFNWWFTNNQFRIGTSGSYIKWNGSQFVISGANDTSGYNLQMGIGPIAGTNYYSIVASGQTPTYNTTNTPFYVDDTGAFSLGKKLTFDTSGNLTVTGTINATGGTFGQGNNLWNIGSSGIFTSSLGTNRLASYNPSFEDATTATSEVTNFWTMFSSTSLVNIVSISNSTSYTGTNCLSFSVQSINSSSYNILNPRGIFYKSGATAPTPTRITLSDLNASSGQNIIFGGYVKAGTGSTQSPTARCVIQFFDASGNGLGENTGGPVPISTTAFSLIQNYSTIPTNAVSVYIAFETNYTRTINSPASYQLFFVDDVRLEVGTGQTSLSTTNTRDTKIYLNSSSSSTYDIQVTSNLLNQNVFSVMSPGVSSNNPYGQVEITKLNVTRGTTSIFPIRDVTYSLGNSTNKWSAIYAATSTISTSDVREKNTIEDSNLGLDFINLLRPVSFKFNSSGNEDLSAGKRKHYGLIAQEVKQSFESLVDDFGGWILGDKNDKDSLQGLRYEEFISPIIKSIQEISKKIDILEKRIALLEDK